jgi:hypothetical protein
MKEETISMGQYQERMLNLQRLYAEGSLSVRRRDEAVSKLMKQAKAAIAEYDKKRPGGKLSEPPVSIVCVPDPEELKFHENVQMWVHNGIPEEEMMRSFPLHAMSQEVRMFARIGRGFRRLLHKE